MVTGYFLITILIIFIVLFFQKHPLYQISNNDYQVLANVSRNIVDRRKIYSLLISNLPVKARFNIVYILATNILG